ncbi:hypothetical protein [Nonomuraea sp. NPDC003214]
MTDTTDHEQPKIGRPTKLTAELQDELCDYLRKGNYLVTACDLVGIHESTVYRWMERGEEAAAKADDALDDDDLRFLGFYWAITRARAEAEAMYVSILRQDAVGGATVKEVVRHADGGVEERQYTPPNSKPAIEWLQRTRPERWGSRKALEVSGPGGAPVQLNHQSQIVEGLADRIAAVKKRLAEQAPEQPAVEAGGPDELEEAARDDG